MANTAFTHDPTITVPSSTVNNRVITWNGTTGKVFHNTALVTINAGVVAGVTALTVDNLTIDGNTITSTDTNGSITLTPNGSGSVVISKVDINSGDITGVTISGALTWSTTQNLTTSGTAAGLSTALVVASGGTNTTSYTKGDVLIASAGTTLTKLGIGSNTHVLTADSNEATGVKWAAAGGALQSTRVNGSRTASAGSGAQAITGAGFTPTTLLIIALDKVSAFISWGWGDDSAYEAMVEADAGSFTQTDGRLITVNDSSGGNTMLAVLTSLDSDGCTITWTKYGSGLEVHFIILFLR